MGEVEKEREREERRERRERREEEREERRERREEEREEERRRDSMRKEVLEQHVQAMLADNKRRWWPEGLIINRDCRVESESDFMVVIVRGKPIKHFLHFVLTILTVGVWVIPWLSIAISGGEKRYSIRVDTMGNVSVNKM